MPILLLDVSLRYSRSCYVTISNTTFVIDWCFLAVSMMAVFTANESPSCSRTALGESDGPAMITVINREVALTDAAFSTCIVALGQGRKVLRAVTYIYVPLSVCQLVFTVDISGVACHDVGIEVYHRNMEDQSTDDRFQQCSPTISNGNQSVHGAHCVFTCYNISHQSTVVTIRMNMQQLPWGPEHFVHLCEFNVEGMHCNIH